jgi:PAS domain S-box-containing protein
MSGTYNPFLVFVSFVVAFLASYTALELSGRISSLPQALRRTNWLLGGAIAMGIGIWSMHFIGMLAFTLPIPVGYDLSTTADSLLIAVVVSFLALITVTQGTLSRARLGAAGTLMGLGIAGMHYTGMAAMQMFPPIRYTFWIVMASVGIAIAASIAALWIAFTLRAPEQQNVVLKRLASAVIMGLAITGMHYTGMDAANFEAGSICLAADKLDTNWLALLVSTSSLTVLIGTLLFLGANTSSLSNSLRRANDELRHRGADLERAIQSLRESEKRFRATFEQAAVGIALVGPDGRWLRVNQKLCDIIGYTREELSLLTFQDITHPEDLDTDLAQMHQVLEGKLDTYTLEKRYLKKDGGTKWINLTVALVHKEDGEPNYFISIVEDIERRKRAEEELRARTEALRLSREELRRLSGHVQHVREEEKTRIARELHDELGQQLVALKMLVAQAEQTLSGAAPPLPAQALQSVYTSIDNMVESVRRIAADLRPVMLDDLGLIPAIDWFVNEFSGRHKVRVVTHIDVGGIEFNRESANTVYRIVQEAMTNVARHSGATVVKLDIVREDPHCVMRIADNGHGAANEAPVRRNSLGLIGLRERVARLGGDLQIVTASGAGFTLTATLPLTAVQATAKQ